MNNRTSYALKMSNFVEPAYSTAILKYFWEEGEPEIDYSLLAQYYGAFAPRTHQPALVHIYDELVEMTLHTYNMDVTKNITIDLYDPEQL